MIQCAEVENKNKGTAKRMAAAEIVNFWEEQNGNIEDFIANKNNKRKSSEEKPENMNEGENGNDEAFYGGATDAKVARVDESLGMTF